MQLYVKTFAYTDLKVNFGAIQFKANVFDLSKFLIVLVFRSLVKVNLGSEKQLKLV